MPLGQTPGATCWSDTGHTRCVPLGRTVEESTGLCGGTSGEWGAEQQTPQQPLGDATQSATWCCSENREMSMRPAGQEKVL
jgi:hypothetical protein